MVLWVKVFQARCSSETFWATPDTMAYVHPGFCICTGNVYKFLASEGISVFDFNQLRLSEADIIK
jgi:hypothetical protein